MGSLPPRLAFVCNVFMYVFVNVTEVFGEGRGAAAAATLRSALSQAPSPFCLEAFHPSASRLRGAESGRATLRQLDNGIRYQ